MSDDASPEDIGFSSSSLSDALGSTFSDVQSDAAQAQKDFANLGGGTTSVLNPTPVSKASANTNSNTVIAALVGAGATVGAAALKNNAPKPATTNTNTILIIGGVAAILVIVLVVATRK